MAASLPDRTISRNKKVSTDQVSREAHSLRDELDYLAAQSAMAGFAEGYPYVYQVISPPGTVEASCPFAPFNRLP